MNNANSDSSSLSSVAQNFLSKITGSSSAAANYKSLFEKNTKAIVWGQQAKAIQVIFFNYENFLNIYIK